MRTAAVAASAVVGARRCFLSRPRGGVDSPVARCGKGDEHLGTIRHRCRDVVVAAGTSGVHELPGVTGIQVRARRAYLCAAIVAPCPTPPDPDQTRVNCELDGVGAKPNSDSARRHHDSNPIEDARAPSQIHHRGGVDRGGDPGSTSVSAAVAVFTVDA